MEQLNDLLLRTAFACMACDGDIAQEEVDLLPQIILSTIQMQKGKKLDEILDQWDEIQRPTIRKALSDLALTDIGEAITL